MIKNKKGGLFAFFIIMILLLILFIAYVTTLPAFDKTEQALSSRIDSDYADNLNRIKNMHKVWPVVVLLSLGIGAIWFGMRKGGSDELNYFS